MLTDLFTWRVNGWNAHFFFLTSFYSLLSNAVIQYITTNQYWSQYFELRKFYSQTENWKLTDGIFFVAFQNIGILWYVLVVTTIHSHWYPGTINTYLPQYPGGVLSMNNVFVYVVSSWPCRLLSQSLSLSPWRWWQTSYVVDEDEVGDRITVRSDEELKAMLSYVSVYPS